MGAEGVEGSEGVVDGSAELAFRLVAAVRRQVRPEHGVVDVAGQVEGEVLLQQVDLAQVALLPGLRQLLQSVVGALDVGGVVLVVVQLHDLARDPRLQSGVVVGQFRKRVRRGHLRTFQSLEI